MNYPLTEFSLKELRILDNLIDKRINKATEFVSHLLDVFPDRGDIYNSIVRREERDLPELREIHVRVLTAIDIVKQRETTNSN